MTTEVSIAKPISGSEALASCIESLRKALSSDDRFSTLMAYTGFHATIAIKFYPQLSFIPPIEQEIEIADGEQTDIAESPTVDEIITLPVRPPNKVREEARLPQPVLVTDGQGRSTEKWVKFTDTRPVQPAIPKNKGKLIVPGKCE